jgi:hypothetical protein
LQHTFLVSNPFSLPFVQHTATRGHNCYVDMS